MALPLSSDSIRVAHLGNSIQYYNDCPRLLEHMLRTKFGTVQQDSCLRGGATIVSLFQEGNGMSKKFATPNARKEDGSGEYDIGSLTVEDLLRSTSDKSWDFVVINDHTQSPARDDSKKLSMGALEKHYLPMLHTGTTVIFLLTAAYRKHVKNSEDLGTFEEFTKRLVQGYKEYQQLLDSKQQPSKIAPVGLAYQFVKNHVGQDEWERLYARDDFHPSPHGTLLEAFVLYCTMVGEVPPIYHRDWWNTARYMQPSTMEPLPIPTDTDAAMLRDTACEVCKDFLPPSSSLPPPSLP